MRQRNRQFGALAQWLAISRNFQGPGAERLPLLSGNQAKFFEKEISAIIEMTISYVKQKPAPSFASKYGEPWLSS